MNGRKTTKSHLKNTIRLSIDLEKANLASMYGIAYAFAQPGAVTL